MPAARNLATFTDSDLALADEILRSLSDHLALEIRVQAEHGDTFACDVMHGQRDDIDRIREVLGDESAAIRAAVLPAARPMSADAFDAFMDILNPDNA